MYADQFHLPPGPVMDYSVGCDAAIIAAQRGGYERKFASEQSGRPTYYATNGVLEGETRMPMRRKRIDQREPPSILAMNPVRRRDQHVERFSNLEDIFSVDFIWIFVLILTAMVFVLFMRVTSLEAKLDTFMAR